MLSTMDDNGAMSVAHRGDKIARKSDRRFYTVRGGRFLAQQSSARATARPITVGSCTDNGAWYIPTRRGAVLKSTITDLSGNTAGDFRVEAQTGCRDPRRLDRV